MNTTRLPGARPGNGSRAGGPAADGALVDRRGKHTKSALLIGGQPPPGGTPAKASRYRDGLVVVLALTTGAVNAVSYLRLGKVFTSVITGNLALLGVSAAQRNAGLAVNAGVALAGYGAGALIGGALAGTPGKGQPAWPRRVTLTLAAELLVLAGFSGGWLATGGRPAGTARLTLLAVAAAAMGMQSAAVRRLGQMSTTYLTSTLTGLLQALAVLRWPSQWQRSAGVLLAFVAGAVFGGLAAPLAPSAVTTAVLVPIAAVLAAAVPAAVLRERGG